MAATGAAACLVVALAPGSSSAAEEEDSPEISVESTPGSLDFYATAEDGQTTVYTESDGGDHIVISNVGSGVLEWSLESSSTGCDDPTEVSWVTTSEESGSIPAGDSSGENWLDWTGTSDIELDLGTHEVDFCIESNDPDNPIVEVPLSVTVVEPDDLPATGFYLQADDHDEPHSVAVGETISYLAYAERLDGIEHPVNEDTEWTSDDDTIAAVDDLGDVTGVEPGETTITGEYDGFEDSVTVFVYDEDAAPQMVVEPDSLEFELVQGDNEELGVTVTNTGDLHLNWNIFSSTTGCDEEPDEQVEWIQSAIAGSLAPGDSHEFSDVNNRVETSSLDPGEYEASLCVGGDDTDNPMVDIPVSLTVTEDE